MNYGLYLSASGVLTNMYRQDVFANNLANVETVGFKPDSPSIRQRDPESIEDPASRFGFDASPRLLEALGGGVLAGPQQVRYGAGPLVRTGAPLDAALTDERSFFAVQHVDPRTGDADVRLTRDGRFTRNNAGELVNQAGHRVLGPDDAPIQIPAGVTVSIDRNGRIVDENGAPLAQIGVFAVADTDRLLKQGGGLFAMPRGDARQPVDVPVVQPEHVEASGVDPIKTLMDMTNAGKAATANADLIKFFDRLMDQSVNTLGRVA